MEENSNTCDSQAGVNILTDNFNLINEIEVHTEAITIADTDTDKPSEDITDNTENIDQETKSKTTSKKSTANADASSGSIVSRPCAFSVSRIKNIMKLEPDLSLTSKESVFLIAKATELFVDFLSKEAYKFTSQGSRKTLQKKDIDQAINSVDSLFFLDAALD